MKQGRKGKWKETIFTAHIYNYIYILLVEQNAWLNKEKQTSV
jgi:hypothetical protein